jgi:hypothetical protein
MIHIGTKPLRLELFFSTGKKWDSSKLPRQFTSFYFDEAGLLFKDLPRFRKTNVEMPLDWAHINEIRVENRFVKIYLKPRDQWMGEYPPYLIPFGPCPKKMIFRFSGSLNSRRLFLELLELHQVPVNFSAS